MDRIEDIRDKIQTAVEEGGRSEGIDVACYSEQFGNSNKASIFVFGDNFKDLTPGNRQTRVMIWLEKAGVPRERVGTILVLTNEEAKRIEGQAPASGTFLKFGIADK